MKPRSREKSHWLSKNCGRIPYGVLPSRRTRSLKSWAHMSCVLNARLAENPYAAVVYPKYNSVPAAESMDETESALNVSPIASVHGISRGDGRFTFSLRRFFAFLRAFDFLSITLPDRQSLDFTFSLPYNKVNSLSEICAFNA